MVVFLLVGNCLLTFALQQSTLFQWLVSFLLYPSLVGGIHIGQTHRKSSPVKSLPQSLSWDWVLTSRWPEGKFVSLWLPGRGLLGETKFPRELRVVPASRSLYKISKIITEQFTLGDYPVLGLICFFKTLVFKRWCQGHPFFIQETPPMNILDSHPQDLLSQSLCFNRAFSHSSAQWKALL